MIAQNHRGEQDLRCGIDLETISGRTSTGRLITQESRKAPTISRSRETTMITSHTGRCPKIPSVT
jgi:hypothetical protein